MKQKQEHYTIVGFKVMPVGQLIPSREAEQIPMDEEDKASIRSSLQEIGTAQPLLIAARPGGKEKQHEIFDGVNRWKIAQEIGIESLPCLLVETDDANALVFHILGSRRKSSAGQKIMSYLELHKKQVLEAWQVNSGKGDMYRAASKRSRDRLDGSQVNIQDYSAEGIAAELECSAVDVRLAIELLVFIDGGASDIKNLTTDNAAEYRAAAAQTRLAVLGGSSPIRRWKAAVGGRATTKGKERANVDYARLAVVYPGALLTVFKNWDKMPDLWTEQNQREMSDERFRTLYGIMPESHRSMVRSHMKNWPVRERQDALKILKESFKETHEAR